MHRRKSTQVADDVYERKTPLEHVLLRPGMYIGSTDMIKQEIYTFSKTNDSITKRVVTLPPGLLKIFDEILVNAIDNKQRDKTMNRIDVNIADSGSRISVRNNGKGIPIRLHKTENMYIPELIFGHLLTGSNFRDEGSRYTGGRHGYGAKLTNIFSKEFIVETSDGKTMYRQRWSDNMKSCESPEVRSCHGEEEYTRVTFVPDLEHFGDVKMSEIILATLRRRVYDVAGCNPDVDVFLNGELVKLNSFGDYAKLFVKDKEDVVTGSLGIPGWDVAVSTSSEEQFSHFSFVNNMATHRGGTHVNLIADHIAAPLAKHIARTNPELKITPSQIKAHMFLMVKASVPDPTFDSQSKDMLTTRLRVSSSSPIISPSFVKRILDSTNIVDSVVNMAMAKQRQALYRTKCSKDKTLALV